MAAISLIDQCFGPPFRFPEKQAIATRVLRLGLRPFDLRLHQADTFDREIMAQAENIPMTTADKTFSLYRGFKILW